MWEKQYYILGKIPFPFSDLLRYTKTVRPEWRLSPYWNLNLYFIIQVTILLVLLVVLRRPIYTYTHTHSHLHTPNLTTHRYHIAAMLLLVHSSWYILGKSTLHGNLTYRHTSYRETQNNIIICERKNLQSLCLCYVFHIPHVRCSSYKEYTIPSTHWLRVVLVLVLPIDTSMKHTHIAT